MLALVPYFSAPLRVLLVGKVLVFFVFYSLVFSWEILSEKVVADGDT